MPESISLDCQGCHLPITDQYIYKIQPNDISWHQTCLKCTTCHIPLTNTCFMHNQKPYCRSDYLQLFSTNIQQVQCDKCTRLINKNDLIMKSGQKKFHLECFKCSMCARKLAPGDEYCHQVENDLILCREDVLAMSPKLLWGTNQMCLGTNTYPNHYNQSSTISITPETSTSNSLCSLSPSTASSSSSSSSSSVTDSPNNLTFNNSMHQNTGPNGANYMGPGNMSEAINAFQMGARVTPGKKNAGYQECGSNYGYGNNDEDSDSDNDNLIDDNDETLTDDEISFNAQKAPKKQQRTKTAKKSGTQYSDTSSPDSFQMHLNGGNHSSYNSNGGNNKPARIRTVLNEKQLHTLRTCYGANPRPDALMKEQLVEMTSLNPRVIRVWFQNKRCKDKKKNMLVRPECGGNGFGGMGGNGFGGGGNQHLMFDHCF